MAVLGTLAHCDLRSLDPYIDNYPIPGEPSCADPPQPSSFNGGQGFAQSPFVICNYEQFNLIRDSMNSFYVIGQDIDASPSWSEGDPSCSPYDGANVAMTSPCDGFEGFADPFRGGLDGRGHVIRNLYSYRLPSTAPISNNHSATIFAGEIVGGAYIRNLGIMNIRYRVGENTAVLSALNRGLIHNVYIANANFERGYIIAPGVSGRSHSIMVGAQRTGGRVVNSFTAMDVGWDDGTSTSSTQQGNASSALVGDARGGRVINCYTRGDLVTDPTSTAVGSIVGYMNNIAGGWIENTYTTSTIAIPTAQTGAIVGTKGSAGQLQGTNYYVNGAGGTNGISSFNNTTCAGTCAQINLADLRSLATLPSTWSADDWDLRGPSQVPALKYGGGPDICGDLCGQIIPNQTD